jgi:hypothetical protein
MKSRVKYSPQSSCEHFLTSFRTIFHVLCLFEGCFMYFHGIEKAITSVSNILTALVPLVCYWLT